MADAEDRILTTEQVQFHFGVGRPRIWKAVSQGRLQVLKHHSRIFYRVDQLVAAFGPPRQALPTEFIEGFIDRKTLIESLARDRGLSEQEARALVDADWPES